MRIFGSISELVDLAFRLAGGKQVKVRANVQTTSGNLITVNVPDVAATGDTQNMLLTAATQTMTNKTLTSPDINGGTVDGAIIGGATPAAGTFTDIVGATLDINTSAELQTLTIPSFATAGVLHNNSSGNVSTSLIVNADVDAAAALAFSKLASLSSGNILVGSNTGVPTSRAVTGDVTIDNLGATTIGATKVLNSMLAGSIDRSKLLAGTAYRILANSSTGVVSENAALTANEAVATDANGQLTSVTGVSATELGYLSGVTSDVQSQFSNKQDTITGAASSVTTSNLTASRALASDASGKITQSNVTATELGYVSGVTSAIQTQLGTKANTSGKLSQFAATTSAELAGVISDETGSGPLVFGTAPTLTNPTFNGQYLGSGSASIASSTLSPAADRSLQLIASAANFGMISSPVAGQQYVLINESASDITIHNLTGATAANQIYTGSNADFTFKAKSAVSVVYDGTLSKWMLTGGGGGAGGLATTYVTAGGITAVKSTHYLTNLSASGQTITLPAGVNGDVIRFSDAGEKWDVYPLTVAPATGEKIDNLSINETLVCDVKRGWVELSYNSTFGGWALMSLASSSGAASGSGEINAILNASAASDVSGWTNAARVTSGSPLDPITSTAFSISNAAAVESNTSGGYYSIATLPTSLRSRKLKVEFYFSTPATDVYRVSVYAGSTRLSLSSDSSGATTLTANVTGGFFSASIDTTTASAYSLNITRTSGTTGACVVTNVIVGPGIVAQGAAISEWQSYTPTGSWVANATYTGWWKRSGSSMAWRGKVAATSTLSGTTQLTMTLPSSLTVTSNGLTTSGRSFLGKVYLQVASGSRKVLGYCYGTNGSNNITFEYHTQSANTDVLINSVADITQTGPYTLASGDFVEAYIDELPIAEWAGSGTVNLGAGSVEYAFNSSATTATDTTSFAYGPQGIAFAAFAPGGVVAVTKRVQFQNPIQQDDTLIVEASTNGTHWYPASSAEFSYTRNDAGTTAYGIALSIFSATQVDVNFYSQSTPGIAWSVYSSYRWRVRKAKAGAAVGFGMANSNESGLIKPRKGQTALTLTCAQGGFSTARAQGIYYQDQDGNHRLKFNVATTFTSASISSLSVSVSGVTFKNVSNFFQPVSNILLGASTAPIKCYADPNSSNIIVSASAVTASGLCVSGDVELESKPSWA